MWEVTAFAAGVILVFSAVLFVLSAVTYRRLRTRRLLIVCLSFLAFFIKGIWLSLSQFVVIQGNALVLLYLFDLCILTLLAFSLLTKG
ncbi:MAG: hypothetical protein N3F63_08045 [Thermoplasmata archaeon]|nr:hypothetical protein [Thermoplasmata archaeon]